MKDGVLYCENCYIALIRLREVRVEMHMCISDVCLCVSVCQCGSRSVCLCVCVSVCMSDCVSVSLYAVSYTLVRAHENVLAVVCRL